LPLWLAGFADALRVAGDNARALEVARDAVRRAQRYGTDVLLPITHRAYTDALLTSGGDDAAEQAQRELDAAIAMVHTTGAKYEVPFIERTRAQLSQAMHSR